MQSPCTSSARNSKEQTCLVPCPLRSFRHPSGVHMGHRCHRVVRLCASLAHRHVQLRLRRLGRHRIPSSRSRRERRRSHRLRFPSVLRHHRRVMRMSSRATLGNEAQRCAPRRYLFCMFAKAPLRLRVCIFCCCIHEGPRYYCSNSSRVYAMAMRVNRERIVYSSPRVLLYTYTLSEQWQQPGCRAFRDTGRCPQASHQRIRRVGEELYPGGTRPAVPYVTATLENEAVEIWSLIGVASGENWLYLSVSLW